MPTVTMSVDQTFIGYTANDLCRWMNFIWHGHNLIELMLIKILNYFDKVDENNAWIIMS